MQRLRLFSSFLVVMRYTRRKQKCNRGGETELKEIEMTETYTFQSPIGYLTIATEKDSVSKVHLEQRNGVISVNQKISHLQHSDLLYETYCQLREYFEGRRREFRLPIREGGTDFKSKFGLRLGKFLTERQEVIRR